MSRRAFLQSMFASLALPVRGLAWPHADGRTARSAAAAAKSGGRHVYPKDSIQDALEAAAKDRVDKTIYVHAGTYRPASKGQALIWLNERHDGITIEAVGDVVLTAANPEIADRLHPGFPAVVNHIVYFGDGISRTTVFRGFKITGANNFTTGTGDKSPIESDEIRKTTFFYTDGGGIKVYARSYPTIENVEVFGNYSSPCGGGVSVEHLGRPQRLRAVSQLHLPRQPDADDGVGAGSAARQLRHPRELSVCRQHGQPRCRLCRSARRRRIPC